MEISRIQFIAEPIIDIGKAVLAVAVASYFFEKLPLVWRVTATVFSGIVIMIGVFLFPEERSA